MNQLFAKMLTTLAVIALVVFFVSVALLIGAHAVAEAGNAVDDFVLGGFAACGAIAGAVRSLSRPAEAWRQQTMLRITSRSPRRRGGFMGVPSAT